MIIRYIKKPLGAKQAAAVAKKKKRQPPPRKKAKPKLPTKK